MKLQILHVPECPGVEALNGTLGPLLAEWPCIQVTLQIVRTQDEAQRFGMIGSPTILVDGSDLFPSPGHQPALSCWPYPDDRGQLRPAPTAGQLRKALTSAASR